MWLKKLFILVLIIVFLLAFSSSYNSLGIDNLAYVVAIGIDTSDTHKIRVSFQFTSASSVSETGSSEKSPSIVNTVDCASISSAINLMNSYLAKQINLSHCKVVVFSEEIAKQGITDYIYTLMNNIQIRPTANIVVSKCNAQYYIESSVPSLENLITKYYDIFPNSSSYTGYTANSTIGDFFNSLLCKTCQPFCILGGLNTETPTLDTTIDSQKDASSKSNESSIWGKRASENIGIAVFKDGQLVGELDAIETLSLLAIRNKVKSFFVAIPNPDNNNNNDNDYLDLNLTLKDSTKVDVDIINGTPYVKVKCSFAGKVVSINESSNLLDTNAINNISNSCNSYLESVIEGYLYKTAKDFKSDINGLGKYALTNFLTNQEFDNYDWLNSYKDCFFDVKVETIVKSSVLVTEV